MLKVSIILPTYNGSQWISKSIESVISQSYKDWELLVIDDGSIDNTAEIVQSFARQDNRIVYIKNEENLGIQKTLNRGFIFAKGDYIARIDDDDVWVDSNKLFEQVNFLDDNFEYGLIGTGALLYSQEGQEISRYLLPKKDKDIRLKILGKNCFVHSSVLFRKSIVNGGYSEKEKYRHVEDQELWLRIGEKSKLYNIQKYMTGLTVSSESVTAKNRLIQSKRMIQLARDWKKIYPAFYRNILIAKARFLFFWFVRFIPIDKNFIYKLQAFIKRS